MTRAKRQSDWRLKAALFGGALGVAGLGGRLWIMLALHYRTPDDPISIVLAVAVIGLAAVVAWTNWRRLRREAIDGP